jgi:hypothetical protein
MELQAMRTLRGEQFDEARRYELLSIQFKSPKERNFRFDWKISYLREDRVSCVAFCFLWRQDASAAN